MSAISTRIPIMVQEASFWAVGWNVKDSRVGGCCSSCLDQIHTIDVLVYNTPYIGCCSFTRMIGLFIWAMSIWNDSLVGCASGGWHPLGVATNETKKRHRWDAIYDIDHYFFYIIDCSRSNSIPNVVIWLNGKTNSTCGHLSLYWHPYARAFRHAFHDYGLQLHLLEMLVPEGMFHLQRL